ncbi:hypothetical protein OCU04_012605 [Sclerotinia nivalis]|uniref:Uncharacterized protein n=1 Tax=Sclerotinia nivalis TaxID=352851 RepID=A0A9X0A908_9HELO|nr:hypothetical protein OCU04_012605 [Sclerotinia nivalis]
MNPIPPNKQELQKSTQKKTTTTNTDFIKDQMIANAMERLVSVPIIRKEFEPIPGLETFEKISKAMFPNEGPCKNTSAGCRFKASDTGQLCLNCLVYFNEPNRFRKT